MGAGKYLVYHRHILQDRRKHRAAKAAYIQLDDDAYHRQPQKYNQDGSAHRHQPVAALVKGFLLPGDLACPALGFLFLLLALLLKLIPFFLQPLLFRFLRGGLRA